jgi:HK97 family phage major capsid protein
MGRPVYENPHVPSAATLAKSILVGHMPSYFVRSVGGIQLSRSDDFAFNADLITFRASMRVDGALPQSTHIKYFIGGAS